MSDIKLQLVRNLIPEFPDEGSAYQALLNVLLWGFAELPGDKFDELLDETAKEFIEVYDFGG